MSEADEKAEPGAGLGKSYRLTRDIDPEGEFNSDELDRQLARVVHGIAPAFLRSEVISVVGARTPCRISHLYPLPQYLGIAS